MENQPAQVSPIAAAPPQTVPSASIGSVTPVPTGEWPPVPPAPAPIIPLSAAAEALAIHTTLVERSASTPVGDAAPGAGGPQARTSPVEPAEVTVRPRTVAYEVDDDSPTMTLPGGTPAQPVGGSSVGPAARASVPRRLIPGMLPRLGGRKEPLPLPRPVRRPSVLPTAPAVENLVWQPRFAYTSGVLIVASLTVISLPLWIVLYRAVSTGAPVSDLIALCMMLTGGYLTGTAIWIIVTEMRGRFRMVDRMARTGEREAGLAALGADLAGIEPTPEPYHVPAGYHHADRYQVPEPLPSLAEDGEVIGWQAPPMPQAITARVEAQQASATATLEASSKLLSSFSAVLKSFGQLYAQVAMLAVALALFVGATVLSMN